MEALSPEVITRLTELMNEKLHVIQFTDNGWTIAHPIKERLDDTLFSCRVFWDDDDPGVRGRYFLNEDGSIGEPYEN